LFITSLLFNLFLKNIYYIVLIPKEYNEKNDETEYIKLNVNDNNESKNQSIIHTDEKFWFYILFYNTFLKIKIKYI